MLEDYKLSDVLDDISKEDLRCLCLRYDSLTKERVISSETRTERHAFLSPGVEFSVVSGEPFSGTGRGRGAAKGVSVKSLYGYYVNRTPQNKTAEL